MRLVIICVALALVGCDPGGGAIKIGSDTSTTTPTSGSPTGAATGAGTGTGTGGPTTDLDGDGVTADGGDCNDLDPAVHPGATDTVGDGIDQDCDGHDGVDGDGDGHPSDASGGADCDDANPAINPAAQETCDPYDIDEDCSGEAEDADAVGCLTFYEDADGDGFGAPGTGLCLCAPAAAWSTEDDTDCFDDNDQAFPGQTAWSRFDRGDGSFDYNCNGSENHRWTDMAACSPNGGGCLATPPGWTFSEPACGVSAAWTPYCGDCGNNCCSTTQNVVLDSVFQECR